MLLIGSTIVASALSLLGRFFCGGFDQNLLYDYPDNHFLSRFKITNHILAPVLNKLFRSGKYLIDYKFWGVRQLGSIYEGLLEYRAVILRLEFE